MQWVTGTLLDLSKCTFVDSRAIQSWCLPSEGVVSPLCTLYGGTQRKSSQRAWTHQFTEYPTTRQHARPTFSGCCGVFRVFEPPLFILCYIFTAFSCSWSVDYNSLTLPWHQPSEVGVMSILPEEETPLKSLPFPRIRSGSLSATAWFWQRPLCPNELLPLLLPSEQPGCAHHLCGQNALLPGGLCFCFFHVTPCPNQREPSESLKRNKCLTRKKHQKVAGEEGGRGYFRTSGFWRTTHVQMVFNILQTPSAAFQARLLLAISWSLWTSLSNWIDSLIHMLVF